MNFFHSSKIGPLPVSARVSPLRTCEAATMKARLPTLLALMAFLLKITSEKAFVQKGASAGLSCQTSLISNSEGFLTKGRGTLWQDHSLRTACPFLLKTNE